MMHITSEIKQDLKSVASGFIIGGALGMALDQKKRQGGLLIGVGVFIYCATWFTNE